MISWNAMKSKRGFRMIYWDESTINGYFLFEKIHAQTWMKETSAGLNIVDREASHDMVSFFRFFFNPSVDLSVDIIKKFIKIMQYFATPK